MNTTRPDALITWAENQVQHLLAISNLTEDERISRAILTGALSRIQRTPPTSNPHRTALQRLAALRRGYTVTDPNMRRAYLNLAR